MKTLRRLCALLLCALLVLGMTSAALAAETNADPADIAGELKLLLNADGRTYQDRGLSSDGSYVLTILYPGSNLINHQVTIRILPDGRSFSAEEQDLMSFNQNQLNALTMTLNMLHLQFGQVIFRADTFHNTVSAGINGFLGGGAKVSAQIIRDACEAMTVITDAAMPQLTSGQTGPVPPTNAPVTTNEPISSTPGVLPTDLVFGMTVTMGTWEQDGNLANGPEPIEWRVLTVMNGQAFLVTKKGIDVQVFNPQPASWTVWETCSLRAWLNDTFLNGAFTDKERAAIRETTVNETVNEKHFTSSGSSTVDRIFILSVQEVEAFFGGELDRTAFPTAYAAEKNGWPTAGYGILWTRTPGEDQYHVALVGEMGKIDYEGVWVHNEDALVRPAMWVNLG